MNDAVQSPSTPDIAAPRAVPRPLRRRLALRLAWLTVATVLLAEAAFLIPTLVRRRQDWLDMRMTEAQLAALSAAVAPDGAVDTATRDELLRLAGAEAIFLAQPGRSMIVLAPGHTDAQADRVDLRREDSAQALARTLAAVLGSGPFASSDRLMAVVGQSRLRPDTTITTIVHADRLHAAMLTVLRRFGTISLGVAAVAGVLLYLALLLLLVRPLRRLTESIAAFRADPERSAPLDLATVRWSGEDEVSDAAQELAAMQRELRAALWRNARLAALGTAVAKVNHDLRGILSPAMLTAERLQAHADPTVTRAGDMLIRVVERAADLTRRTLEFTREAPLELPRKRVSPRQAVEDAAEQVQAACPALIVINEVCPNLAIMADPESLVRVLGNLLRNAGEAAASCVTVAASMQEGGDLAITVADDGPGLPEQVRAGLFRPFVSGARRGSTGLGLAIVHDLMRAHGGDAKLLESGPGGTRFCLILPRAAVLAPPATAPRVPAL